MTEGQLGVIAGMLISAFFFIFLGFVFYMEYRKKSLQSQHILAAIEKGVELPQDYFQNQVNYLSRGLIWTAFGLAMFVALWVQVNLQTAIWGLVPAAMGGAYILIHYLQRKQEDK